MNKDELIQIDLFCLQHGIEIAFITTLKDYEMIEIFVLEEKEYFSLEQLSDIEKIIRLHYDLQINMEGIDVILNLLNQIDNFQNRLQSIQNRLDFLEK